MRNSVLNAGRKRGNHENPNQHTGRKCSMVNDGLGDLIHGIPGLSLHARKGASLRRSCLYYSIKEPLRKVLMPEVC